MDYICFHRYYIFDSLATIFIVLNAAINLRDSLYSCHCSKKKVWGAPIGALKPGHFFGVEGSLIASTTYKRLLRDGTEPI